MLHLLKIEWLKVKHYRTFWVLLLLIIVGIPALNYMSFDITDNTFPKNAKQMQQMIMGRPFSFPTVWQTAGWLSSLILFIPSILIITITTNEFTYKTHRQNIIDGWSRDEFIIVKLVEVLLLALLTTVLVFFSALWVGYLAAAPGEAVTPFNNAYQIGYFFMEALSYLMLAFLLSVLIKRAGLVLGLFFLYSMIVEQMAVVLLGKYANNIGRFLPLETNDRLILNPFSKIFMKPADLQEWKSRLPLFLTLSVIYLMVYCFGGIWYFRKKDL